MTVHPAQHAPFTRKARSMYSRSMFLIAFVAPVLTVPQLWLVWINRQTAGVSQITWGAYTIASGCWLIYGIIQKQKPLILAQLMLFILDFLVVLGVYLFR